MCNSAFLEFNYMYSSIGVSEQFTLFNVFYQLSFFLIEYSCNYILPFGCCLIAEDVVRFPLWITCKSQEESCLAVFAADFHRFLICLFHRSWAADEAGRENVNRSKGGIFSFSAVVDIVHQTVVLSNIEVSLMLFDVINSNFFNLVVYLGLLACPRTSIFNYTIVL